MHIPQEAMIGLKRPEPPKPRRRVVPAVTLCGMLDPTALFRCQKHKQGTKIDYEAEALTIFNFLIQAIPANTYNEVEKLVMDHRKKGPRA